MTHKTHGCSIWCSKFGEICAVGLSERVKIRNTPPSVHVINIRSFQVPFRSFDVWKLVKYQDIISNRIWLPLPQHSQNVWMKRKGSEETQWGRVFDRARSSLLPHLQALPTSISGGFRDGKTMVSTMPNGKPSALFKSMTDDTVNNQRCLPDPEICRTRYLGQTLDFSDCLVENPEGCKYALHFGSRFFCNRPDRRSFEKTGPR